MTSHVEFTRNDTKAIKGVAILMMLFHHLAAFSNRFPVGFAGFESPLWPGFVTVGYLQDFALMSGFCVSLFFFLGGYGLYKRWIAGKLSVKNTLLNLYKSYWKVFLIFIPIAFLFFSRTGEGINELTTIYTIETNKGFITELVANFIGASTSFNKEWWFFAVYLCAIPMGVAWCRISRKSNNFWIDFLMVLGADVLLRSVFPAIAESELFSNLKQNLYFNRFLLVDSSHLSAFFAGIVFAKHDGICKIKELICRLPMKSWFALFGLATLMWMRTYVIGVEGDILCCVLVLPLLSVCLDKLRWLRSCLGVLGKHSTNMWLIHSFYCYYFLEVTRIVYCTQNVWLSLIILIAMTLGSSLILDYFYRGLGAAYQWIASHNKHRKKAESND